MGDSSRSSFSSTTLLLLLKKQGLGMDIKLYHSQKKMILTRYYFNEWGAKPPTDGIGVALAPLAPPVPAAYG